MNYQLPFDQMTLAEKLHLMEQLWDNVCHLSESIPSPDWHGTVLAERKQRIDQGESKFAPWSKAKHIIRSSVS